MAAKETEARRLLDLRELLDDQRILEQGTAALMERLGPSGMIRFLAVVAGGIDRFEDRRKEWEGMSIDEALAAMGLDPARAPSRNEP